MSKHVTRRAFIAASAFAGSAARAVPGFSAQDALPDPRKAKPPLRIGLMTYRLHKAMGQPVPVPPAHLMSAVQQLVTAPVPPKAVAPMKTVPMKPMPMAPPQPGVPTAPPVQPVTQYQAQLPKKPSVLPIVGAGLLALFFLRK